MIVLVLVLCTVSYFVDQPLVMLPLAVVFGYAGWVISPAVAVKQLGWLAMALQIVVGLALGTALRYTHQKPALSWQRLSHTDAARTASQIMASSIMVACLVPYRQATIDEHDHQWPIGAPASAILLGLAGLFFEIVAHYSQLDKRHSVHEHNIFGFSGRYARLAALLIGLIVLDMVFWMLPGWQEAVLLPLLLLVIVPAGLLIDHVDA